MDASLSFNNASYRFSYTVTELDREKQYFVSLQDAALTRLLGASPTISFSKVSNSYGPAPADAAAKACYLALVEAIESNEHNKS